ncbi:MAG: sigma-E processing peptidase SpoIIGA [Bacilli bacterium]|nr:sigma-E processing peptidase SpoIIGA [Bacilli bacterium]
MPIIIYIDLVILINFIIDLLLLISVDLLLKRKAKFKRIIIASILGSISTLLLFYINNNFMLLIFKLFISILMVIIAFKYETFNYFKDNIIWLYILGIILGGTIFLLNNQIALVNNGLVFSESGFKINIIILCIISPIIIYKYLQYQKSYQNIYSETYDVDIYYKGIKITGTGFLDTGNKIKDPYFGRPIILINKDLIKKEVNTFLVPYNSVGYKGMLKVFKPDKVKINEKITKKVLIGLADVNLNGIKIVLNTEVV